MNTAKQVWSAIAILFLIVVFSYASLYPEEIVDATPKVTEANKKVDSSGPAISRDVSNLFRIGLGAYQDKDYETAIFLFREAGEGGHVEANYLLGKMYVQGIGVSKDPIEAFQWFHNAADGGDASSQAILGAMYKLGEAVAQDDNKAEWWLRKAAEQGNIEAKYTLSIWERDGGIGIDNPASIEEEKDLSATDLSSASYTKNEQLSGADLSAKSYTNVEALNKVADGIIAFFSEDYILAFSIFEQARQLDPSYVEPYFWLGRIKAVTGDPYGAIKYYDKAIEINPDDRELYFVRGYSKEKIGDVEGGKADKQKYLNQ
ncbi:MAG: tetratricopeptide repeat protein [Candidatus Portiera sp.]|nr:tetratricopeptide repeat protein [Portiera sp.]